MKVLRLLGVIFGLVGAGLLAGAVIAYVSASSFENSAQRATGTVIGLAHSHSSSSSGTYAPVVRFSTPEGREVEFESSVSSSPPAFDVGETVDVLYDPANPDDAAIDSFWQLHLVSVILGGIGLIFFAIGGGLFLGYMLGRRKRRQLMASGKRISAQIQGIDLNHSVRVNGRHPFCITSQWLNPDTGEIHVFRSDGIWYDPSMHLRGETIDVLIDPTNPNRYHVDTSFLPKEA